MPQAFCSKNSLDIHLILVTSQTENYIYTKGKLVLAWNESSLYFLYTFFIGCGGPEYNETVTV